MKKGICTGRPHATHSATNKSRVNRMVKLGSAQPGLKWDKAQAKVNVIMIDQRTCSKAERDE